MRRPIRHARWIVLVALAAVAAAYYALLFLPQGRAIDEARGQLKLKRDCVVRADRQAELLRAAAAELHATEAYNAAWERTAPTPRELSTVFSQIQALAKTAGTATTRFDPEPVVRYESVLRVPLHVEVPGSFAGICEFLEGLESLPAPLWGETLWLKGPGDNGELVTCQLDLAIFGSNLENSDYVGRSD